MSGTLHENLICMYGGQRHKGASKIDVFSSDGVRLLGTGMSPQTVHCAVYLTNRNNN